MTDEQFCKIESALTGEPIDKVEQLVSKTFTGRELKEYLEEAFALHSVSDYKKLNIHECLNDLEKAIEVKTGVLDFIDKGSLRYQLKKAIDKMICCR